MDERIREIARKIGAERKIPVEVKQAGNSYYLYRSTTRWDKREKKRKKVSEYLGRIDENGMVEKNFRTIYEFGNSELLMKVVDEITPSLKRSFPDHWSEIVAMSVVRAMDPRPLKLIKSAWEKLYASTQIEASLSENTLSEKMRIIGSDYDAQVRFSRSLMSSGDTVLFDLSSIFSRSENINLASRGYNPKSLNLDQINFALVFSRKKKKPIILEVLDGSVRDMKAYDFLIKEYDLRDCIIIADRGLASYEMPKRKGIYFIVAIRRDFDIIDYSMPLGRSFIYHNRGINSGKKAIDNRILYMFEDLSLKAEEETNIIRKIEEGIKAQKDLDDARSTLGKVSLLSNLDMDPKDIYEMYKSREEVEQVFDAMKNDLENDKAYLHTTDGIRGYFFITLVSLYIYYSIYRILRERKLSPKISVRESLLELSRAYVIVQGARRTMAAIPDKTKKLAEKLDLSLFPKILRN